MCMLRGGKSKYCRELSKVELYKEPTYLYVNFLPSISTSNFLLSLYRSKDIHHAYLNPSRHCPSSGTRLPQREIKSLCIVHQVPSSNSLSILRFIYSNCRDCDHRSTSLGGELLKQAKSDLSRMLLPLLGWWQSSNHFCDPYYNCRTGRYYHYCSTSDYHTGSCSNNDCWWWRKLRIM